MNNIEKDKILDFVTGVVSAKEFYEEYPSYLNDAYLLEQYGKAIKNKDAKLLEYIYMLPCQEVLKFKDIFTKLILENWHIQNEDMIGLFQSTFNNDFKNIDSLILALKNIPEYLQDDDMKYPYIRKIIYAIGAQPEPNNIEALENLVKETEDIQIKELALHQIKKRRQLGRWESKANT